MRSRKLLLCFLPLLLALFVSTPVRAETTNGGKVMINSALMPNIQTTSYNGTLLVPAKELAESLGGSFTYDNKTMIGTARVGENELAFHLDDGVACFDGKYIQSPAPMKIINYRFMIPVEFTAAKLGAESHMSSYRNTLMLFQPTNGKLVYSVMTGDTLWVISQLFGTTMTSLRQLNGITGDMIYTGQKLVIKDFPAYTVSMPAYTTGGATLRSGAGFGYSIPGYLGKAADITVTGKSGEWYKVMTTKGNAYLYYTVVGMKQESTYSTNQSGLFDAEIPVDTSMDTVSYLNYTVVKGDYIWALAQKYSIPDYELASANNIPASTTLYPGNAIKIPVHNIAVKKTLGPQYGEILDWFKEAQYLFPIGKSGKLTDTATGKSFTVKRTMGANHADSETPTLQDTQMMKEIFGGSWNWSRRSFILEVDGRRFAVSVAGMPHDGVDGVPYLQTVDNRSDGYGTGPNYDSISGNGMDGHFDLYFLNCLRHVDNKIDPQHQYSVLMAGGLQ